jgi:hypothetical protein
VGPLGGEVAGVPGRRPLFLQRLRAVVDDNDGTEVGNRGEHSRTAAEDHAGAPPGPVPGASPVTRPTFCEPGHHSRAGRPQSRGQPAEAPVRNDDDRRARLHQQPCEKFTGVGSRRPAEGGDRPAGRIGGQLEGGRRGPAFLGNTPCS